MALRRTLIAAVLVALGGGSLALADTVRTPMKTAPLLGDPSTQPICVALNIGFVPYDVSLELLDDTNTQLTQADCPALPVGQSCSASAPAQSFPPATSGPCS